MALNRIPFKVGYQWFKSYFISKTDGINNLKKYSLEEAVDISMNYFFEDQLEDNGMDRMVLFINAFLYEIEHGKTDPNLTNTIKQYIKEFETGEYDDLFTSETLTLVYKDIATIKTYLSQN